MLLAATVIVALPLYRVERKASVVLLAVIVGVAGLSAAVYSQLGTPDRDARSAEIPDVDAMVRSLSARLRERPDDLAGWKMLGRSYLQLRNFAGAVEAFEQAVAMESSANGQTLTDLGEAVLMLDGSTISGRAGALFESGLAAAPHNPKALFYAGMAALDRGDKALAADRWEALLATSPPAEIQDILRPRIAELRGTAAPAPQPEAESVAESEAGPILTVKVSLSAAARQQAPAGATVFVIARDPARPAPPVAVLRRKVSELPDEVPISDADAMIPGRVPSAFSQLEIIARISLGGDPSAQSGDWFGSKLIDTAAAGAVDIVIDQAVP